MEVLYVLTGWVPGTPGAAVLGWTVAVIALVGTMSIADRIWRGAGPIAVAALLAGETAASSMGWAYSDWGAALFGVALLAMLEGAERPASAALDWTTGLLAGFAIGIKLTAVPVAVAALVSTLWGGRRAKPVRSGLVLILAMVVALVPWFGKNVWATGAPLYPFAGPNRFVSEVRQQEYRLGRQPIPVIEAVGSPVLATFTGVEGAPGPAASIGPLLLGLLPAAILLRPAQLRRPAHPVVAQVSVGWLAWSFGALLAPFLSQSRLQFSWFPAWAILASGGFVALGGIRVGQIRPQRLAGSLVLVALSFSLIWGLRQFVRANPVASLVGLETEEEYVTRRLGAYAIAMERTSLLPGTSRAVMLWEPRSRDCQPVCLPDAWLDRWREARRTWGSAPVIVDAWRRQGITHVLLHAAGAEFVRQQDDPRYAASDWVSLEELSSLLELEEAIGDAYLLYRLPP
jgi:hypothetical protein